ncbi:uncharacterized protein LOC124206074 [Daphnia pulex]|uniref:uncharacterized protein LOC124206074 n=1 Tax=Daphnia pulex TaxID=6669 RepID=UPI001EDCFF44|nr:uncharacterized protein LOC124206074 [Daphnia pulex]
MPKRQNEADGDDEPTGCASKKVRITPGAGTNSTTENPPASCGLKNTLHGNVFQLKLLMLFLLRGIGSGFQFRLGTEIPGMGGKFDDLIFKFKKSDQTESYRFLQAKHKQDEEKKITAADLLNDNEKDFSLPKYFRSYYREVIKQAEGILPETIQDCIICTNIGFDSEENLNKSGIELIPLDDRDNILSFDKKTIRLDDHDKILTLDKVPSNKKSPTRYKLRNTDQLRRIMTGWSDIHLLAKTMLDYVTSKKQLNLKSTLLKIYHVALIHEKVIDKIGGKLCTTFLEGDNSRFREILSELTFVHYCEKFKLKKSEVNSSKKLTYSDEKSLNKQLPKYPQNKTQSVELDFGKFEEVYDDLIAKNIFDEEGRTSKNLTPEGLELRGKQRNAVFIHHWKDLTIQLSESFGGKIISRTALGENKSLNDLVGDKEIADFLDKLVFAVNTPSEVELDDILKKELDDRYSLHESDFQSDFILRNMLDWFKEKDSKFMSSEEGKNIFKEGQKKLKSLRVTAISIDYQNQLKEVLEFNDKAVEEMKDKISKMLISPDRIGRIATSLPERTAVKVIAALEKLRLEEPITNHENILQKYFQYKDSYLMTSLCRLKDKYSKLKKTLKSEHSHHLLVVVCEDGISTENDDEIFQELVKKMPNKRIIIISQDGAEVEDKLNFGDLNEQSKRALLEKQIDFQGTLKSVGDLIKNDTLANLMQNRDLGNVIDSNSIEELLMDTRKVTIPKCSSARFEPSLYIKRKIEHPWENSFYDELAVSMKCTTDELQKECTVNSQGYIKWLTAEDSRKKEIWEQMKIIVGKKERQNSRDPQLSKGIDIAEKDLINKGNRKGRVFIISGIAGTGKSTILSNYYEIIKRDNPDIWVIRIDLVDCNKELAEFDFSLVNESSAIAFFANIFAKDSPFTRSLLTQRFQTDGRIVVMLDGFDESNGELHEKIFQLIKAVTLTKMDALYITTRAHLKEELQNQIFQFSYHFKNFSQEDQVNCLSKYWGNKLKMLQTTDGHIQLFSKSLVERLTTTLNDKESDLIGIPLQCRMLAECFETQLQDTIQQGLPIESLIESISENNLDLASLYSLFMEKKLEIYRAEKIKFDSYHPANPYIDVQIRRLEKYLRELAIKTIVSYPKHLNVLLGESNSFQSKEEIRQEEENCTSGGVCFGFLDKTDKGEAKFLHRTYAEYLFAKYLYAGFLPEDNDDCNHLLTSESVRKLIFMKILGDDRHDGSYDCSGVRVFFNSMLKERVHPRDNIPFHFLIDQYHYVLHDAIEETNSNIFLFLCDCLDMKFSKEETGRFLHNFSYLNKDKFLYEMYCHKSKVFERFMSYYDSNDADHVEEMFSNLSWFLNGLDPEENKEKNLKFVSLVVDFLDQTQAFLQISLKDFLNNFDLEDVCVILKFLFSNKYYDSPLKKILKFLSSKFMSNLKIQFEICLVESLESHSRNRSQETLYYILENLRILEEENKENEILKGISHHILIMNSQLFKSVYKRKEEEGDTLPINIQSLLVRDSHGMTRLHRATLRDDEKTVGQILETVRISFLSNETEAKKWGKEVLHNVIASAETGVTPLYVAAVFEHENLRQKMLNFLKEMLSEDELRKYLTDTTGFLGDALWDAIKWEKIEMFRIVLESVKKIFGQDHLIALLKAANTKYESGNVFSACHNEMFFQIVFEVIVNGENGYKNLYDLLFQNWKSIEHLQRIDDETFQTILSFNGLDDFIKRIFDTDAWKGMYFVVYEILDKFTTEQSKQLFRILITENSGTKSYFARYFLDLKEKRGWYYSKEILERFSEYLDQSVVNELLVRNEYEVIKKALYLFGYSLVDFMFSFLTTEKEEVIHLMMIIVLQLIEKITETSDQEGKNYHDDATRYILEFVFERIEDCVKESDLSKLIDLITNRASKESKDVNIWIDYLVWKWESWRRAKIVDKFLKCVLDKLGPSAVEKLVRKEAVTQVLTRKCCSDTHKLVDALLRHLSKEKREEIELEIMKNVPATLKTLIDTEPDEVGQFFMNVLHLQYVTKYADRDVLLRLIDIITQPYKPYPDSHYTDSVWSSYICCILSDDYRYPKEGIEKFLLCVSDKLGKNKVKELVLHSWYDYGAYQSAISTLASYGDKDLVKAILAHLTEKDRQEIQRGYVDPVLESDEELLSSSYSTDEEIASSQDSMTDNSEEAISE